MASMLVIKSVATHYKWHTNQKEFDSISLEMEHMVSTLAGSVPRSGWGQSLEITDLEVVEFCEKIQNQAYMSQREVLGRTRQIF